ncbi:MAG: transcriptional regulator [Proteobacteria bacterium]|nr:transcriptional regulator [Pseudomonadota bacterium]
MEITPIKTQRDYKAALREIEGLMSASNNPPEGDRLDVLVTLVTAYEAKHHPIDPPDPIDAIRFRMDQQGLRPVDLVPYIGSRARVSHILAGKRPLTLPMIRKLTAGLGIPADVLIQESQKVAAA